MRHDNSNAGKAGFSSRLGNTDVVKLRLPLAGQQLTHHNKVLVGNREFMTSIPARLYLLML